MRNVATLKAALQLAVILAILAGASVLAVLGHIVSADAYSIVMVIGGGTAVAGGIALSAPTTNTSVVPHLVLVVAVVAMAVALAIENIFTSSQTLGIFSLILGSGAVGVGMATANAKTAARMGNHEPPPAAPTPQ